MKNDAEINISKLPDGIEEPIAEIGSRANAFGATLPRRKCRNAVEVTNMLGESRFEEGQSFAPFVYLLLVGAASAALLTPLPWPVNAMPTLVMMIPANLLYMKTDVSYHVVRVRFGWLFPLFTRTIETREIESIHPVTYSPLAEYGGWGIRGLGSKIALNARGNRGVLLGLSGGRTVLIGSQRPDELAQAIQLASQ